MWVLWPLIFWILRGCRSCCSFPEKGRGFSCRAEACLVTVLREDVAAVSLGQGIFHFLSSFVSVLWTHSNLTRKALVVKAVSAIPTLLWGSLPPLLCQNWERLCTSSSKHPLPERGSGQGNVSWGGQHQMGSGCRRWWMQLWSHSRCLSQPGSAGVSVTSFETVAGVVLVALKHPWGSTGGIEEWVGMA